MPVSKDTDYKAIIAAAVASWESKGLSYGDLCYSMAAMMDLPKTTAENWIYKFYKPEAQKLVIDAKKAGRIDDAGTVVKANLPGAKFTGASPAKRVKSEVKKSPSAKRVKTEDKEDEEAKPGVEAKVSSEE